MALLLHFIFQICTVMCPLQLYVYKSWQDCEKKLSTGSIKTTRGPHSTIDKDKKGRTGQRKSKREGRPFEALWETTSRLLSVLGRSTSVKRTEMQNASSAWRETALASETRRMVGGLLPSTDLFATALLTDLIIIWMDYLCCNNVRYGWWLRFWFSFVECSINRKSCHALDVEKNYAFDYSYWSHDKETREYDGQQVSQSFFNICNWCLPF